MFEFFKKKVPISNELKEVQAIRTYKVVWISYKGHSTYADMVEKCQFFISKEDAEHFAESLRNAHNLIGNSNWRVIISEE